MYTSAATRSAGATSGARKKDARFDALSVKQSQVAIPTIRFTTKTDDTCSGRISFNRSNAPPNPKLAILFANRRKNPVAAAMPKSVGVRSRDKAIEARRSLDWLTAFCAKLHTAPIFAALLYPAAL